MVGQLLLREHGVHDPLLDRYVVSIGGGVDELTSAVLVDKPAVGDRAHQLSVLRLEQPGQLLAQLRRHLRLGRDVRRRFVRGYLHEVGLDPEPGETVLQKHPGRCEAHRLHHARRHQQDLVASAREVIGSGRVERRPRHHSLARLAQPADQLAQVLKGGHGHADPSEMENHTFDARVVADGVEALAKLSNAEPLP